MIAELCVFLFVVNLGVHDFSLIGGVDFIVYPET